MEILNAPQTTHLAKMCQMLDALLCSSDKYYTTFVSETNM